MKKFSALGTGLAAVLWLALLPSLCLAQGQVDRGLDFVDDKAKEDVKTRLERGRQDYEQQLPQLEQRIKQFMEQNKTGGTYSVDGKTYSNMPKRLPLLDTQGVSPQGQQDYTDKDVRVMLNPQTFGQCYEERQVFEPTYEQQCEARCGTGWRTILDGLCRKCEEPSIFGVPCGWNQYYVSEVYIPVFQSRTYPGRAMGSFDPKGGYLSGQDQRQELGYEQVRTQSYQQMKQKFTQAMTEYFGEAPPDDAIPDAAYFSHADYTGRDRAVADGGLIDTQSLHTLVYMTNFNRQHSRGSRPPAALDWVGYVHPFYTEPAEKCWFSTLPDAQKRVVGHATYSTGNGGQGHADMTFALNHRDVTTEGDDRTTPYGKAMLDDGPQVKTIVQQMDGEAGNSNQLPTIVNSMLGQYEALDQELSQEYFKKGLQRVGAQRENHDKDFLYHAFFRLYNSRNFNYYTDPLHASIMSGFSFYVLNSLETYQPNNQPAFSRPILWSFYKARPGHTAYAGKQANLGNNKIYSTDKIQIIYPTVDDGELGSACFRPESLSRSEYVDINGAIDKLAGSYQYWGFRRDLRKRLIEQGVDQGHLFANEVRIAYWIKRVNCHCTMCAQPDGYGCSVLNNGDRPTDNFYGTLDLSTQDPILKPPGPFGQWEIRRPTG